MHVFILFGREGYIISFLYNSISIYEDDNNYLLFNKKFEIDKIIVLKKEIIRNYLITFLKIFDKKLKRGK